MDITLCILIGFLCFVFGLIAGVIVVYRVITKEDDKQCDERYELLRQMNKAWGDYCRSLIHEFYGEKLKELEEKDEK